MSLSSVYVICCFNFNYFFFVFIFCVVSLFHFLFAYYILKGREYHGLYSQASNLHPVYYQTQDDYHQLQYQHQLHHNQQLQHNQEQQHNQQQSYQDQALAASATTQQEQSKQQQQQTQSQQQQAIPSTVSVLVHRTINSVLQNSRKIIFRVCEATSTRRKFKMFNLYSTMNRRNDDKESKEDEFTGHDRFCQDRPSR